eukprot:4387659-Prymnesium_polylepis.1
MPVFCNTQIGIQSVIACTESHVRRATWNILSKLPASLIAVFFEAKRMRATFAGGHNSGIGG